MRKEIWDKDQVFWDDHEFGSKYIEFEALLEQ